MEGKTNFSRRLKQVHGLTWLTLATLHILRQNYVTAPTQWSVSTTRKPSNGHRLFFVTPWKSSKPTNKFVWLFCLWTREQTSQVKFVISSVEKQRIQFTTRVGVLGQDRSETKKKSVLVLVLQVSGCVVRHGLVRPKKKLLFPETRPTLAFTPRP